MKKFIYLRKFNESSNQDLDFQTFKEIMFEITDDYNAEFNDYSESESDDEYADKFYDCVIQIPNFEEYAISDDQPLLNLDYLDYRHDGLPPFDDMDSIDFKKVYNSIDDQLGELEKLKNNLDSIINRNRKLKNCFETIKNYIIPRFESFRNFDKCLFGFDSNNCELRISFEIKDRGFHE